MHMGLVKTFKLINITFLVYKYPQGQNLKLDPEVLYCQALYMNIKHPPTKHSYLGLDKVTQMSMAIFWNKMQ